MCDCAMRWEWASGWEIEQVNNCFWAGCFTHSSNRYEVRILHNFQTARHILKQIMFSFSINATCIIDCTKCDTLFPLPTCFLVSCFRDPLSQCWSLPFLTTLSLFFSLNCLFLSSLWHAFYKLGYNDCMQWQKSLGVLWWYFGVSQWYVCVRKKEKREVCDCGVCLCAAGLVCMKSSTSVVELVMLLCSQVGNSSPPPSVSLLTVLTQHNPCCESCP